MRIVLFTTLIFWAAMPACSRAQDLPTVRGNVRESDSDGSSDGSGSGSKSWHWEDWKESDRTKKSDPVDSIFGMLAGLVIAAPYYVPHKVLDDGFFHPLEFPSFPYDDAPGYLQDFHLDHTGWMRLRKSRNWAGRISFEEGTSFDDQHWIGGRALIDTIYRLGIEADVRHWDEAAGPWQGDNLWIGETDAVIRFAQNEHWIFRSGLGVNWLSDALNTDFGFNFTYGVDWFPINPLVFSSEIDLGSLGHAWLFHVRSSAGVTWKGTEFYAAYDYYDIGEGQLKGLSAGVRLWF